MKDSIKNRQILFLCPDQKWPVGGIKQIYRQVDILNANGYNAFVTHRKKGFRVNWFSNKTSVNYFPILFHEMDKIRKTSFRYKVKFFLKGLFVSKNKPQADSILVFPELYGLQITKLPFDYERVIFNQNCYYTFDSFKTPLKEADSPYHLKQTKASIVVSHDSESYLNFAFPDHPVFRIFIGINDVFKLGLHKKKQIAYMPRKLGNDLNQVINLIFNKPFMKDWQLVEISNKSEDEVAKILGESLIYLSTNNMEGFGLPPVEAMASGCYVIGYGGNAGKEYFHPEYSSQVPDRDVLEFAKKIEKTLTLANKDISQIIAKGVKASEFVRSTYTIQKEKESIIGVWNSIDAICNQKTK